jgi:hypothetical protein
MSLTAPFDILTGFPGWTTTFDLMYRQEQSRTAGGKTYVKDLGAPLWHLAAQSKILSPNNLDIWRGRLKALENGLFTFYGYPMSRCYPIAYPNGAWPTGGGFSGTSGVLTTINVNRKGIVVSSLPAGFVVSIGDYLQIGTTDLHQVVEAAVANGSGVTPQFEVRPFIWPAVVTSTAVSVLKPHCLMAVDPGSISTNSGLDGKGTISFTATEQR